MQMQSQTRTQSYFIYYTMFPEVKLFQHQNRVYVHHMHTFTVPDIQIKLWTKFLQSYFQYDEITLSQAQMYC